jgi:hypothetical protein
LYHRPVLRTQEGPSARVVERNKRPGVCYALTENGIELPVIDLTHPAFGDLPDRAAQEQAVREYLETMARASRTPSVLRDVVVWLMSRRSLLMRAIHDSGGSYLSGLSTYLLKLGPENLGAGYAGADRSRTWTPRCAPRMRADCGRRRIPAAPRDSPHWPHARVGRWIRWSTTR